MVDGGGVRHSNFEILRIIAILSIISFHYALKGGWNFSTGSFSQFCKKVFLIFGEFGVNLFMLITGYFLSKNKKKWVHLVLLCLESVFYTLCINVFLCCKGWFSFNSIDGWLRTFFPDIFGVYWYVTAYIAIYIISPYINLMLEHMEQKVFKEFLTTVLILWCFIPSLFQFSFGTTETGFFYTRLIWLIVVYCIGAYIRKFGLGRIDSVKTSFGLCSFTFLIMLIFILFTEHNPNSFLKIVEQSFWAPNTILMVILSVCFFNMFRLMDVKYIPIVNIIASTTLGVYMLHDGGLQGAVWNFVKNKFSVEIFNWRSLNFVCTVLLGMFIVFFVTVIIDLLRKQLEKFFIKPMLEKITSSPQSFQRS